MKKFALLVFLLVVVGMLSGCVAAYRVPASADLLMAAPEKALQEQNRMLIWRAWLTVEVASVSNAVASVTDIARASRGYVEGSSDSADERAHVTLRVPAGALTSAMDSVQAIGTVTSRRVASEDVTEKYVDIDARLKTKIALRDRLRALLDKAHSVEDVLTVEKELSRVQADIDSMQALLKSLKGKADLATVHITLKRRQILGPVGYLFKGAWWAVEKLFVIQK